LGYSMSSSSQLSKNPVSRAWEAGGLRRDFKKQIRRIPDPPKNLGHDFPLVLLSSTIESHSLLSGCSTSVCRSAVGGTTVNPMSLCTQLRLTVEFGGLFAKSPRRGYSRRGSMAFIDFPRTRKAGCRRWVRAPILRSCNHGFNWRVVKYRRAVPPFAMDAATTSCKGIATNCEPES